MRHQAPGDCAGAGAEIDRCALGRQALDGAPSQLLRLPARHVDAGIHLNIEPAEGHRPGDPGQRLAGEATGNHRIEDFRIARSAGKQLLGLLRGCDEPGAREQGGDSLTIVRCRHGSNWNTL